MCLNDVLTCRATRTSFDSNQNGFMNRDEL